MNKILLNFIKKQILITIFSSTLLAAIFMYPTLAPCSAATTTEQISVQSGVYQYCPTYIDGVILYCSNEANPWQVKDGIYIDGKRVLTTTPDSWDSVQVCDPTVVAGNFTYNNKSYKYLMAYLGCATYDCTNNEIGFAVSNNLYKWTKVSKIVAAPNDGSWGVGQPSLLNYNGAIYLFYTSGTVDKTTTYVEQLDCTNLNEIKHLGQKEITCNYDYISNADFAFTEDDYIYMICDTHPFPTGALNFVSAEQSIYMAQWDGTLDGFEKVNWDLLTKIGNKITGHERNHNGCFVRNKFGELITNQVYVTTADSIGTWSENLYTYRFRLFNF